MISGRFKGKAFNIAAFKSMPLLQMLKNLKLISPVKTEKTY